MREGNNIHHRLWGWQVHALGSNLGSAGPRIFRLSLAIIVQGLDKRTLALLDATSVGADPHLENQIDASIPALVDGLTECGKRSSIVRRRRNEKNDVLRVWNQNTDAHKHIHADTECIPTDTFIYMHIHIFHS